MMLKKRMSGWNLKGKISFFLTVTILMASVVIMVISTVSAVYNMTRQSKNMAENQLSTLASNYADTLQQYHELAVALVIEDSVQRYCRSFHYTGTEYNKESGDVYNYLVNMMNVRSNMNFVVVEREEDQRYVYKGNSSIIDARFETAYGKDYMESIPVKEGSTVRMSFGNRYFRDGKYTLTIYHPVYSTSFINGVEGMLVLNFNDSLMDQLYVDDFRKMNSELLLIDCDGKIVSVSDEDRIGRETSYTDKLRGFSGSFQENGMLINYQKVREWNYYLVNEIPVYELYRGSIESVFLNILVMSGITVFAILILRRMMESFYEPINRVVTAMDDVAEGKLGGRIDLNNMDADSRKLAEGFNTMMDGINNAGRRYHETGFLWILPGELCRAEGGQAANCNDENACSG